MLCLLSAQSAIAVSPEAASAEWTESERPCNVAPGAVLPQPVRAFEVGEPVVPTTGYFTYGQTPEAAPPSIDFTSTANWGDGTTSQATVEASSVGDCYGVTAPSHAYAGAGTYTFSYTVHDLKTGLDHTLGAVQLHISSTVPRLPGGPSSPTIHPTVGVPSPPGPVRFLGRPMLAAVGRAGKQAAYEIVFRLDRPLPHTNSGHIEASVEAFGTTGPVGGLGAHRGSACYAARVRGVPKQALKDGAHDPFTLIIGGSSAERERGQASLRRFGSFGRILSVASKELGCR